MEVDLDTSLELKRSSLRFPGHHGLWVTTSKFNPGTGSEL